MSPLRHLIQVSLLLAAAGLATPLALGQGTVEAVAELAAAITPAESKPATSAEPKPDTQAEPVVPNRRPWLRYGSRGLELRSDGGAYTAHINLRSQLRFSSPFVSAPRTPRHFEQEGEGDLRFRRARFKMDGQIAKPWIEYKYEHDLVGGKLLDLRFDIGPEWLRVRFGQWKADYSRERIDSSGKQQFAERSIVNRAFTVDRQKGVMLVGRVGRDTPFDSEYYAGVFTGQGRGVFRDRRLPDGARDGAPLRVLRYQWNALGGGVGFSQSDLERGDKPRLSVAVASAANRSAYTRFSSSGGGQLDGFEAGLPGQYAVSQRLEETAFKYRGLSVQHEWHWKRIDNRQTGRRTSMRGSYLQAGYFLSELDSRIPEQLELAARFAFVDPDVTRNGDLMRETGVAANWFFKGHADKLTFDVSRYRLVESNGFQRSAWGVRAQWDVSF